MKQKKTSLTILWLVLVSLVLGACKPAEPVKIVDETLVARGVKGTMAAIEAQKGTETAYAWQTQTAMPTDTPVPTETPTNTPEPTFAAPTAVVATGLFPTATTNPTTGDEPGTHCLQMAFVKDGGIEPSYELNPGQEFSKNWTIKNIGTCTWTTDFRLTYVAGQEFGSGFSGFVPVEVPPGETVELTLSGLIAPNKAGEYRSHWMLAHPGGARFGYGPNRGWTLNVQIVVKGE